LQSALRLLDVAADDSAREHQRKLMAAAPWASALRNPNMKIPEVCWFSVRPTCELMGIDIYWGNANDCRQITGSSDTCLAY